MKKINIVLSFIIFLTLFSCEKDDYQLGEIVAPSNLTISIDILGADESNPFGDGSGYATFVAQADDAITYKFIVDGNEYLEPSGIFIKKFTDYGINSYTIEVIASGIAGLSITDSIDVEVQYLYIPPADLVESLITGSWRVMAESPGHIGVHEADSFHDGEVSFPVWYSATEFQQSNTGMYDDRLKFLEDGSVEFTTNGSIFGKSDPLIEDFGDPGFAAINGEYPYYPLENFSSTWNISEDDDGNLIINFSGNCFTGIYVGGNHSFTITNRSESIMYLKTIGFDGNAWYTKITNLE